MISPTTRNCTVGPIVSCGHIFRTTVEKYFHQSYSQPPQTRRLGTRRLWSRYYFPHRKLETAPSVRSCHMGIFFEPPSKNFLVLLSITPVAALSCPWNGIYIAPRVLGLSIRVKPQAISFGSDNYRATRPMKFAVTRTFSFGLPFSNTGLHFLPDQTLKHPKPTHFSLITKQFFIYRS